MTSPTLNGIPAVKLHDDRDERYAKCRDFSVSFMDRSEISACQWQSEEIEMRLPKMLADMAVGIFFKDDIRKKVFSKEVQTPEQAIEFVQRGEFEANGKARDLHDFLMMSAKSRIDNTLKPEEAKKQIADRLGPYLKFKFEEWNALLQFTPTDEVPKLSPEEEATRLAVIEKVYNFPQLIIEIFDDLTQTELMNSFGFFLRRVGVKVVKPEVIKVLDSVLTTSFRNDCDSLLNLVHAKRREGDHIRSQSQATLLNVKEITGENEFDDDADTVVMPEPPPKLIPVPEQSLSPILAPIPEHLSTNDTEAAEAEQKANEQSGEIKLPALPSLTEGFEEDDLEDTGEVNRVEVNRAVLPALTKRVKIALGVAGATVALVILLSLLAKHQNKQHPQPKKGKDPIASKSTLETMRPPVNHIKVPKQVVQADATVAPPMRPTPPPGPKKLITPGPTPPQPDPPNPVPDPIDNLKVSNPNLTKISQLSVNDLPANYTDKYKSLFLGQQINLDGEAMISYVQNAIDEIGTRSQRRKLNKYIKHKMRPGWAMYMASIDDPWFENVYAKKHRGWHKKGKKDLKKYLKLKGKKKLSKRKKLKLEKYEEQMRVGKLTMESLRAVNPGKDPNNVNSANFSNENGEVATIAVEMAQVAGLQVPEIITTELLETPNPKQPETQLADTTSVDDSPVDDGPQVDDDTPDPVQVGQDLLKKVQQTEAEQAVKAKVASNVMNNATDGVLAKLKKRREEKSQAMEDSVDRVLDRLEISKKFKDMAKARDAEPKTDNDYYASIEVEKVEEPDPFDVAVAEAQAPTGTDEDYYSEIKMTYEDDDYAEVEITKEDPVDNYYASIEVEEPKPKGVLSRIGRWFGRKAA